ncbi:MAG TPA: glucans biosynthesis glucosyltransferase MdoH [Casimicrobiaceae bacterium]|nr:glucans biosynthesis glucosyltransferase MdoH [Casimicrobiaceae bacterium]
MELHPADQLSAAERMRRYLARLPLSPGRRAALLADALSGARDTAEALGRLHASLAASAAHSANAAYATIGARLRLAIGLSGARADAIQNRDVHGRERIETTPRLARSPMAPHAWPGRRPRARHDDAPLQERRVAARDPGSRWRVRAAHRRIVLVVLIVTQTLVATNYMRLVLPYHGRTLLEIGMLVLFGVLFAWISAGFWTALAGFWLLARGGDTYAISRRMIGDGPAAIPADTRTAVVMPICNEDVPRLFAGLRATYESLRDTGVLDRFDFFVLSDTGNPDTRVAEVDAWFALCTAVDGFGRIFYRWRQHRIKRKSGNIADFCRRWGRKYRYMVVLDADSVMSGECLTSLVRIAEANPDAGIIQTAPRAAGRDTLYARVQQFATGVYGPLFTAGLHAWQFGESHYFGHNAIIRVAPFIRYCAIGRLPGRGALSGEILSHDFVEAALMRRAGWGVWIAYDLPGSYEEMPPNLIDELARDRRWCQGNLMNFRLFWMKGLHPAHRAVFMTGALAYLSAPLWFLFLILSTALLAVHTLSEPRYFVHPYQLFPIWPEWRPEWAIGLFSATAVLLFLPKLLAGLRVAITDPADHGGRWRLAASLLGEVVYSAMLAPIRMLFHTQFVVTALAGRTVRWKSPPRGDNETDWRTAIARHGWHTLVGVVWAAIVWWLNPSYLWWLLPVIGALILSIPLSVFTSRTSLGRKLRRRGYLLIPEESRPPEVIRATRRHWRKAALPADLATAIVDPVVNALVCAQAVARPVSGWPREAIADVLVGRALRQGLDALGTQDRNRLLADPPALSALHFAVWTSPAAHESWREAIAAAPSRARTRHWRAEADSAPTVAGVPIHASQTAH